MSVMTTAALWSRAKVPAKMTADKGEDYVTVHGTAPDGYTLVSAAEQYVTFVANGSAYREVHRQ